MRPTQHLRRRTSSILSSAAKSRHNLAAIDIRDGWHFGAGLAATMLTAADRFPTDFKEGTQPLEKQNHFDWGSRGSFEFRIYC